MKTLASTILAAILFSFTFECVTGSAEEKRSLGPGSSHIVIGPNLRASANVSQVFVAQGTRLR